MMPDQETFSRYSASFTAGSLLYKETTALLPLLQAGDAEKAVKEEIKNNTLLHINSESARKRVVFEVLKRTQSVDTSFWEQYAVSAEREQKVLLFYICLKTYSLMFDFHFNVTVKQWKSSSQTVEPYFYQMELEEIAARNEQVENWSDTTKRKAISVYLRILRDIRLLNKNNELLSIHTDRHFWKYFVGSNEVWFLDACLLDSQEKERILQL